MRRAQESRSFRIFRRLVYAVAFGGYGLFLVYLTYWLVIDKPSLTIEQVVVDDVDVPDMEICGPSEVRILRCDFVMLNNDRIQYPNCSDFLSGAEGKNISIHRRQCIVFATNKTMKYKNPETFEDGLSKIGVYFQIDNLTYAQQSYSLGTPAIGIQLMSPYLENDEKVSLMDRAVKSETLLQWNMIAGITGYVAVTKFKTVVHKSIMPGDVGAIFGFTPKYHQTSQIETVVTYFPRNNASTRFPPGTTGYFSVAAGSFIQQHNIETRGITILGAIAAAGGVFGMVGGAYVMLFGDTRLNPWGLMHRFGSKPKDEETPGHRLFREDSLTLENRAALDNEERIRMIETDFRDVKQVIKEYLMKTSRLRSREEHRTATDSSKTLKL